MSAYSAPRCPLCSWHLAFAAGSYDWVARCWNSTCPVGVLPAHHNEKLVQFVRARGRVRSTDVAASFAWRLPNANAHLVSLLRIGVLRRRADPDVTRGRRFVYELATLRAGAMK